MIFQRCRFHCPQHLVSVDDVDEWLLERHLADAAHVEAVDVVPPVDLVVLVLAVLDRRHVQRRLVGEHQTVRRKPLVTGEQHCDIGKLLKLTHLVGALEMNCFFRVSTVLLHPF